MAAATATVWSGVSSRPQSRGELLMPGDAAEQNAKVNARRHAPALRNTHGDETDVVGIGHHADRAAVVEGDIELARQPYRSRELKM